MLACEQTGRSGNRFIDSLSPASARLLERQLVHVLACNGATIASIDTTIRHVFFPTSGVISVVATMRNGGTIELGAIGCEGFYGVELALGCDVSAAGAMVQIAGAFLRVDANAFVACLEADPPLRARALRYAEVRFESVAQLSACNRLHPLRRRYARSLLTAYDRTSGGDFALTQVDLASMLGVRRPGVSVAAAALGEAGLIEYVRGHIRIVDRDRLAAEACECYDITSDISQRLLGYDTRRRTSRNGDRTTHR